MLHVLPAVILNGTNSRGTYNDTHCIGEMGYFLPCILNCNKLTRVKLFVNMDYEITYLLIYISMCYFYSFSFNQ